MSLGKVPMKAGGGAKRNASVEQGTQISTATQRAATTTRHRHTEKLSGGTLPTCILTMASHERGKGRGKLPHKCTKFNMSSKLHDLRASTCHLTLSKDLYVGYIGAHDLRTPLTSIGSILT